MVGTFKNESTSKSLPQRALRQTAEIAEKHAWVTSCHKAGVRHGVCKSPLSGSPPWKTTRHASLELACFGSPDFLLNFLSSRSISHESVKKPIAIALK